MPLWNTNSSAPKANPNDVITDYGWTNPQTGEVHAFINGKQVTTNSLASVYVNLAQNFDTKGSFVNTSFDRVTGHNLLLRVCFKQAVVVTGSPYIVVTIGSNARHATFSRYRGPNVLEFVYTVVSGDSATAGNVTTATAITKNSGTITYVSTGGDAVASFTAPDTSFITVNDTSAPAVATTVLSSNGSAPTQPATGDVLTVKLTYDKRIIVTGQPYVSLTLGVNTRHAVFSSVAEGNQALFTYTVISADAANTSGVSVGALTLNGGTITDAVNQTATNTISAPDTSAWTVNHGPTVSSSTITSTNTTTTHPVAGDKIKVTVNWNKPTVVTGAPYVVLSINGSSVHAAYTSADSTSTVHLYEYTVQAADRALGTQFTYASPVNLNSGTIKDSVGNNATLTFSPASTTAWIVGQSIIATAAITSNNGTPTHPVTANIITVTLTWDASITVTGTPQVQLNINATARQALYTSSGSTGTAKKFVYTVVGGDAATSGQFTVGALALNGGTLVDGDTDAAFLTFTPPTTTTFLVN